MAKIPLSERFWQKVAKAGDDECWNWTVSCRPSGYGSFRGEKRKMWDAHKLAWILTHGAVPEGLHVLHKCDNRQCCNPGHLFLGTHQDNMDDMAAKGRRGHALGQDTHRAKLTPDQVREIRHRHRRVNSGPRIQVNGTAYLAREFGVTRSAILGVVHGDYWAWLEKD